jgi:dihydrofolate reductase
VIGGAEIFAMFEPLADRVELTEVHGDIAGDVTMPAFDAARWREESARGAPRRSTASPPTASSRSCVTDHKLRSP